jgi:hypothetical protein
VLPAQLEACIDSPDGGCTLPDGGLGSCLDGVCVPLCGNGSRDSGEDCDGNELGGASCTSFGYYTTEGLTCRSNCSFDLSGCSARCGDGIINGPEQCDGVVPVGTTCSLFGTFGPEGLACNAACAFDLTGCAPLSCPAGYVSSGQGVSRYRFVTAQTSWLAAEQACEADGTHLVVIDSMEERDAVRAMTVANIWVGTTDIKLEGIFVHVTGAIADYKPWAGGEPGITEDCVEQRQNGEWNDHGCNNNHDYVCECDGLAVDPDSY